MFNIFTLGWALMLIGWIVTVSASLGPSRPFFYVYRSTYAGLTSQVLPATTSDEANLPSRCMVLGCEAGPDGALF